MTSTVANFRGRLSARSFATARLDRLRWLIVLLGVLFAASAWAENVLQDITYAPQAGGRVQITMKFAGPVGEPRVFTTESPARIAVDIADTRNGFSQRRLEINTGATNAVSAVEA